ncbi:hypothetical protein IWQ60_012607, partial [Tieghemiomyces parasiticus]
SWTTDHDEAVAQWFQTRHDAIESRVQVLESEHRQAQVANLVAQNSDDFFAGVKTWLLGLEDDDRRAALKQLDSALLSHRE